MLNFMLIFANILAENAPFRRLGVKFSEPSKAEKLVEKFVLSIKQQQMQIEAEKATEIEEKRRKIYNDYLVSRIKSSILADFDARFY